MPLTKAQKQEVIEDLKEKIDRQKAIIFADISGLKVKDLTSLRKLMKEKDCEAKVAKKTLLSLAFKEKSIPFEPKKLAGEIILGFGYKDEVFPFKIFYEFSKEKENLKILGGLIGKEFFEKEKAIMLAQIPSREELLAKMIGSLKAPIAGLVNVFQGNLRSLIYILSTIKRT